MWSVNLYIYILRTYPNTYLLTDFQGDSGGPLVCENNEITGIFSWSEVSCADERLPGVYSHVGHLRYWIDEQVEKVRFNIHTYLHWVFHSGQY